jgi:hypothetical protein
MKPLKLTSHCFGYSLINLQKDKVGKPMGITNKIPSNLVITEPITHKFLYFSVPIKKFGHLRVDDYNPV